MEVEQPGLELMSTGDVCWWQLYPPFHTASHIQLLAASYFQFYLVLNPMCPLGLYLPVILLLLRILIATAFVQGLVLSDLGTISWCLMYHQYSNHQGQSLSEISRIVPTPTDENQSGFCFFFSSSYKPINEIKIIINIFGILITNQTLL